MQPNTQYRHSKTISSVDSVQPTSTFHSNCGITSPHKPKSRAIYCDVHESTPTSLPTNNCLGTNTTGTPIPWHRQAHELLSSTHPIYELRGGHAPSTHGTADQPQLTTDATFFICRKQKHCESRAHLNCIQRTAHSRPCPKMNTHMQCSKN